MVGISPELEQELRRALKGKPFPSGFVDAIAAALHNNGGGNGYTREFAQQRDAVQRVVKAGRSLRVAITRADALFPIKHPRFLPVTWQAVAPSLDHMVNKLEEWLSLWEPPKRKRGNPHEGRRRLRLAVFRGLADVGVSISKNKEGAAAKIVRAVLEEQDRREGSPARNRASFNGSRWAYWVAEHEYFTKMARADLRFTAAAISDWMNANPPPRAPGQGK